MKETRHERLVIRRAIIVTGVLLAVSGVVSLARGGSHGLRPTRGVQDTSPPSVSLDPEDLDFGEQVVGRWSRARRITVTNTGGQPLAVDSVSVGVDDALQLLRRQRHVHGGEGFTYRACTVDVNFALPNRRV